MSAVEHDLGRRLSLAVGGEVHVEAVTDEVLAVDTPFAFPDGDHLVVRLRPRGGDRYEWTDLGHTLMHLSYSLDVESLADGKRGEIFESGLRRHGVVDREGELVLETREAELGGSLLSFAQTLIQVADLEYLTQDRVRSTFADDLRALLRGRFGERAHLDYVDPEHDPQGLYPVTCLVNSAPRPVAVMAVPSDEACAVATIVLQQFRSWGRPIRSLGVFADQEKVNRKAVARLTDVADKQYSALSGNEERIVAYVREELGG